MDRRTLDALQKLGQDLMDRASQAVTLANLQPEGTPEAAVFTGNAYAYSQAAEMLMRVIAEVH